MDFNNDVDNVVIDDAITDDANMLGTISERLKDIKRDLDEDVEKKEMNPKNQLRLALIYELYSETKKEDRAKLGDCLASNGGAVLFTDYIRMLTDGGTRDPQPRSESSLCLTMLRGVCCNYSHVSLNFCLELGKAGLFSILVSDLERCKDSLEDETVDEDKCILPCLTILYNCARDSRARRYLAEAKVLDVLPPFIGTKNACLIVSKIVAILTSSYPIEEGQSERPVDNAMLYVIVLYLGKAVSASDHKHLGFTAEELVDGLKRLANNDLNKVSILNAGIAPLLENLLETGDVGEKTVAAVTLWNLCFAEENKLKLSENRRIMNSLQELGKQPGQLGHLSSGALWFLEDQGRSHPSMQGGKAPISPILHAVQSGNSEWEASCEPTDKYIMISYSSRQKILALKVKTQLEKLGHLVWIDMDSNEGKNFETAKKAVEESKVFVICISQDYETQPSCRMEAEYARDMKIPMIPILAESGYKMSGWLRAVLDGKVCIDFSDHDNFEKGIFSLNEEIVERGEKDFREENGVGDLTRSVRIKFKETSDDMPSERPIKNWTTKHVMSWATENKLAERHFQNIDGESLAYLRDMKKNSPEFYQKYVVENLGITGVEDLKNLSRGLENLSL